MTSHLERLITLLEMTAIAGRPLSVVEAQKATGLPRPTCYRLLQTLADHRLIESPDNDSRYVIGERLIRIALLGKSDIDVRRATAATLHKAAIQFGDSVFLSRLRSGEVEIIEVETPNDPSLPFVHPGLGLRPLHACSSAKAIAAFAEPDFQEQMLAGDYEKFTERTLTTPDALRAELAEAARRGYAECDQEMELGVSSVSAPVQVGNVGAMFSVGAIGSARRFTPDYRADIGEKLVKLAREVGGAIQLCSVPLS